MIQFLAAIALFALAPPPQGLTYTATPTIVTATNPNLPIYSTPRGVGYDATAALLITKASGTFICSGSLIGYQRTVITAAHCMQGATSAQVVFFPPGGGTLVLTTTSYVIHPGYTGAVIDENDIAVVNLPSYVTSITPYALYGGDPLGQNYNQVGFGASGTGNTGAVIGAGTRRQAWNTFDYYGDDAGWGGFWGNQRVLFADFDNGLAAQDASCRLAAFFPTLPPACHLGLGASEGLSAGGDSGGPLLVGGQLAAVTSFGLTFRGGIVGDIDGALNSTFGEFAGFVSIAMHRAWIAQFVTPEPATILLMATGLLALVLLRRRRVVAS